MLVKTCYYGLRLIVRITKGFTGYEILVDDFSTGMGGVSILFYHNTDNMVENVIPQA